MIKNYPEAVNSNDCRGYTPLHTAVMLGNEELVNILLSEGNANTGIQGHRLITPLHLACQYRHMDIAKVIFEF